MATDPGRNDPCPCGSGRKYKNCCRNTDAWYQSSTVQGIIVGVVLLLGVLVIGGLLTSGGGAVDCPPGEVWSEAHGHCH